jgi:hypothetical protein
MNSYRLRRIVPVVLTIIVIAIIIAALVSLARVIFFSNSQSSEVSQTDISRDALLSSGIGRAVSMNVRGPIVADENFKSYQILVTPSQRKYTTFQGYLREPIKEEVFDNSIAAYEQLVYALDKANLAKGVSFTGENNDLRGVCATGTIYEFKILNEDKTIKQLWTSSCSAARGSLSANLTQLTSLFRAQIPNIKSYTSNLWR